MADPIEVEDDGLDALLDDNDPVNPKLEGGAPKPKDDNADLRVAMADLARNVTTLTAPKPAAKELTQDQKDELWGVFNPEKTDPKFLDKFFRLTDDMPPEQKAEFKKLWADMQQGLVRQSVVGSRNLFQMELEKLREEFAPMREYVSDAKAEKTRSSFYMQYPELDEKTAAGSRRFEKIINATARTLESRTDFKNEGEYFKALAEGAAEAIAGVLPEFKLGVKQKPKPTGSTPRLPRTSVGGTGGAGNAPAGGLAAKGDATDEFLEE